MDKVETREMTVSLGPKRYVGVSSYREASEVVCRDRTQRGVGFNEWSGMGIGRILVDGVQVAYVSYNGRVWEGVKSSKVPAKEITW